MHKSLKQLKKSISRPRNLVITVSLLAVLSIALMLIAVVGLNRSQDIRQQASIVNDQVPGVQFSLQPANGTQLIKGQPTHIDLFVSTQNLETTGIQWIVDLVRLAPTEPNQPVTNQPLTDVSVAVDPASGLTNNVKVEPIGSGFTLKIYAFTQPGSPFKSANPVKVARINLTPNQTGQLALVTDNTRSLSTLYGVLPPQDRLQEVPQYQYPVVTTSTTPPPGNTNTPTPSTRPNNTPTPSPTATPTAGAGGVTVKSCNEVCASHAECAIGHLCYSIGNEKRCRLSTNPTNAACEGVPDQGISRSCNQYCADSRECADGLTCWYNQCRLASNIESTTCAALTQTQTVAQAQLCNIPCTSNSDCAINLRCYQGACRLAVNPTSSTCSLPPLRLPATSQPAKGQTISPPAATATPKLTISPTINPSLSPTQPADTSGATDSGTVVSTSPTQSPTQVTPTPIPPVQPNALSELINNLRQSGRLLPVGVLVIGVILLLSSFVAGMFGSSTKTGVVAPPQPQQQRPPMPPSSSQFTSTPTSEMTARLKDRGIQPPRQ